MVIECSMSIAHYSNYLYQFDLKILLKMVLLLALWRLLQKSVLMGLPPLPCKKYCHGRIVKVGCFLCLFGRRVKNVCVTCIYVWAKQVSDIANDMPKSQPELHLHKILQRTVGLF